jgi:hypothetical protein
MTTPNDVYKSLIIAYNKASKASDEWNELNDAIKEREKAYAEGLGLSTVDMLDRLADTKDKAKVLKDIYNKYTFWKGEVERHSAMLSGVVAYEQYRKISTDQYTVLPGQSD